MPFYVRKSISAGPFRFNFSKGGVGMSVGVKGLRLGTGPRGHYVHAGRGGLYYRASLGRAGQRSAPGISPSPPCQPAARRYDGGVEMIEVESGDVLAMRDASVAELLDEMNAKAAQTPLGKVVGWSGIGLGLAACFISAAAGLAIWLLTLPAWLLARWLDSYQRRSVIYYDLEPETAAAYETLTQAFDGLAACGGTWHVAAGGQVRDLTTWKRNAGASHIVDRKPTSLRYGLPQIAISNVNPPSVQVGAQTLHFLPDVVMVAHGKRLGAVGYADLELRWQDSNFIEEGQVPRDAQVIGQTWKHPNKSGGPDRRFKDNHQIPICRYEVLHLTSPSGLNELLEFSRTGLSASLAAAVRGLADLNGRTPLPRLAASA